MRLTDLTLVRLWVQEFGSYSRDTLQKDVIAGLTVAAVALPLALAFGVASGATAAAGLVTAIVGGVLIGAIGGAPYQISGPTGAMSAVLILVGQQHGLEGIWVAGVMAGFMILALGVFKLGKVVNFIPVPVITGFTSGIAVIIFVGQIDNALGIQTASEESAALKIFNYLAESIPPVNQAAVISTLFVAGTMILLPRIDGISRIPAPLVGIMLVTGLAWGMSWDVTTIGTIPQSIVLEDRLFLDAINLELMGTLLGPAIAIAALGSIESLLAGVVAGRMTGTRLETNQELVAQGIGNIVLPFIGGVPATAAIARITVAIKSGGVTRLVSFIQSGALLAGALLLSGAIARIPLAALAGVLLVTAWRMNEWGVIRFYFRQRLKTPVLVMLVTMVATVSLDLTQAILIGVAVSLLFFINQISRLNIVQTEVDWDRLRSAGFTVDHELPGVRVVYISGALFFGAVQQFIDEMERLPRTPVLILSMRGVPMADVSSIHALEEVWENQKKSGGQLYITGLQPQVERMLERSGLTSAIGKDRFFWGADQAIMAAAALRADSLPVPNRTVEDYGRLDELPLGVRPAD